MAFNSQLRTLSLFSGGGGLDLGFSAAGYNICCSIDDSTEKTSVQVFPSEYMGVVAKPPPPYIPTDISVIGFLQ